MATIKRVLASLEPRHRYFGRLYLMAQWNAARARMVYSDYQYAHKLFDRRGVNWEHGAPLTFNDKLWYLKLSNRDPLLTTCADKYRVREYVASVGLGHILKKQYAVYEDAAQINFADLPNPTYLKCSHGSGLNFVYRGQSPRELNEIKWRFAYLLGQNSYWLSREWPYRDIVPRVVAEEVITPEHGGDVPELQFFCFQGEPKLVMYNLGLADATGAHKKGTRWTFDADYNLLDVQTSMPTTGTPPPRPDNYEQLLQAATTLAAPFPHVRVDLFGLPEQIYFNEMTFYSGGGFVHTEPLSWQETIGSWLDVADYSIAGDAFDRNPLRCLRAARSEQATKSQV